MGAARAALGATIEPETKGARSHARNMRTNLDDEFVITNPPSVTIRPKNESIMTKNKRPLRFQETNLSTETGARVISRPILEPDSINSRRPDESMVNMRRRVDDELHEAISSYPIFQNSRPKHSSPLKSSPSRTTLLTDVKI
ncbi:hypothetical protein DID88_010320 [Monilinia fructigena]|uniref:Uncharacterized protein n=1 Tax=Monilinia fructigena TaxID=38457 RepID=A0A395IM64_9HELO|nr:hypothetical protein DID88_010320 [Monilinia fructigena]